MAEYIDAERQTESLKKERMDSNKHKGDRHGRSGHLMRTEKGR